ncbi:hypothetical protein ACFWE3_11010 [Mycobacteriaceae bacterium NPDC060252]
MNRSYEPHASLVEYFDALAYGKHSSGLTKCSPAAHQPRHKEDRQARALTDFFTDRDGRDAASAVLKAGA